LIFVPQNAILYSTEGQSVKACEAEALTSAIDQGLLM